MTDTLIGKYQTFYIGSSIEGPESAINYILES